MNNSGPQAVVGIYISFCCHDWASQRTPSSCSLRYTDDADRMICAAGDQQRRRGVECDGGQRELMSLEYC